MAKVRRAQENDGPLLVAMGERMHAESPRFSGVRYSPEKCLKLFEDLMASEHGVVFVAEEGDGLIGMFAGFAMPHFFSVELTASEVVMYVVPGKRGGLTAPRFVKAFEAWAFGERNATEVMLGVSTEVRAERTSALYESLGYRMSGYALRKQRPISCALPEHR